MSFCFGGVFLTTAQYVFFAVLSANNLLSLGSALDVFAKTTTPVVGLSKRWTTPKKTFPSLVYLSLRYSLTISGNGLSPVLSPWTKSPARLLIMMMWLSSNNTWRLFLVLTNLIFWLFVLIVKILNLSIVLHY